MPHDVFWFEIAVHDPLRVRRRHPVQDLIEAVGHIEHGHGANAFELGAQGPTLQTLHDDVRALTFENAVVIHAHDARVVESRCGARLAAESGEGGRLPEAAAEKYFHS